jgi:hypothetical protein
VPASPHEYQQAISGYLGGECRVFGVQGHGVVSDGAEGIDEACRV